MFDRFNMTQEENIFYAKRNVVDYIWKSAKLEGLSVTFPDTEAIFNGVISTTMQVNEVVAVNNLKHACQFLFDTIDYPLDYTYICKLHQLVGSNLIYRAEYIRIFDEAMGGTKWKPEMPDEAEIKERLQEICTTENITERAVTLMLYCMRTQIFSAGNKRVSMLAGNHILISNGKGIISVPIEQQEEFRVRLLKFYETNDYTPMIRFVYDCCIDGIQIDQSLVKEEELPAEDYFLRISQQQAGKKKLK